MTYYDGRKYKKQASLRKYYDDALDKVHNAMKHGSDLKKYHVYLKLMGRSSNGHKTRNYRTA